MDEVIASRLLASINANRLVILCGAGLSMSPPSNLPSAARLAQNCANRYLEITGHRLTDDLLNDLEKLADHFRQTNEFRRVFIEQLIPWREFRRKPNNGHETVADFLTSGVAEYGITTNLDTLIEIAADQLGESDFCASVNPADLNRADLRHKQLIKLHGCCLIDRPNTIWCKAQLDENPIIQRIERFKEWATPNLRERDLLIIGFWSDWGYLNNILEKCVSEVEPRTVILVDPSDKPSLQSKAPLMWNWATSGEVEFFHLQESGSDVLDDLRRRFCALWLVNLITRSKVMYQQIVGSAYQGQVHVDTDLPTKELYSLRRDFSGVPSTEIPYYDRNDNSHKIIGVLHLLLLEKGGQLSGSYYTWQGKKIRLIEASGQLMSLVKDKFSEEPLIQYETTVCAGAIDDAVPSNIVRSGEPSNIIRNDPTNDWITHKSLLEELLGCDER